MPKVAGTVRRKADHIRVNLEEDVRSAVTSGLEDYRFVHQALPELDLDQIDTRSELFGKQIAAPVLISSMTGGTQQAAIINERLAAAAQSLGVAMGVGSQRAAIEHPDQRSSFAVSRKVAPDILLFANIGAIQLNYGFGVDECRRAVEMIEADALVVHLNPLQEAVQEGGDTNWAGLEKKLAQLCKAIGVPVVAKEVGWGISEKAARTLDECGVAAIDVAGAGGTSWSQVEMHRAQDPIMRKLAATFVGWGIPTARSILNVSRAAPGMKIFGSGGLQDGLDIAKCIALGASLGGMAGPFLRAAAVSAEAALTMVSLTLRQLKTTMFAAGAGTLADLPGCIEPVPHPSAVAR